jgi:hypothetical protein
MPLLATRGPLFRELGGLDPEYGPGLYGMADYCFRVRQDARAVLYQPEIALVDLNPGGRDGDDSALDDARFRQRWERVLRERPTPPTEAVVHEDAPKHAPA